MYAPIPGQIKRTISILIILLLVLPAGEVLWATDKSDDPEKNSSVELMFKGTGSVETKTFTVEDGWKIEWKTESPTFKLSAHGSSRRPYVGETTEREEALRWFERLEPIVLANTTKTRGSAVHPLGGTFYFKVVANGPWEVHLKTFKDTKDYLDVPYTGAP